MSERLRTELKSDDPTDLWIPKPADHEDWRECTHEAFPTLGDLGKKTTELIDWTVGQSKEKLANRIESSVEGVA